MFKINWKAIGCGVLGGVFALLLALSVISQGCSGGRTPTGNTGYFEDAKDRYFRERGEPNHQIQPTV